MNFCTYNGGMHYSYCPHCGQLLTLKDAGDDGKVPYCLECHRYYFDSFSTCVIGLIENEDGEIVTLKQNYLSPIYWTLPAGFMKPDETAEEAFRREVKEELGLELEELRLEATFSYPLNGNLMIGFFATAKKQPLRLSKEIDEGRWTKLEEAGAILFPPAPGNASYGLWERRMSLSANK